MASCSSYRGGLKFDGRSWVLLFFYLLVPMNGNSTCRMFEIGFDKFYGTVGDDQEQADEQRQEE